MLTRTQKIEEFRIWSDLTEKEKEWFLANSKIINNITEGLRIGGKSKKEGGACSTSGRLIAFDGYLKRLTNPPTPFKDSPSWIAVMEEKILGVSITSSSIDESDTSNANATCKDFIEGKGGVLSLVVTIKNVRKAKTKTGKNPGQDMAFLTIQDNSCSMNNVCVFPLVWEKYKSCILEGNNVLIVGEKDKKQGSFIVKKVNQI